MPIDIIIHADDNTTTADPITAQFAKWVLPHVIDWLADCDAAQWVRDPDDPTVRHLFAASTTIGPEPMDVTWAATLWMTLGKVELAEWATDHAADYMAYDARNECGVSNPYQCPCPSCAEEVALDRARRSDDPRMQSL